MQLPGSRCLRWGSRAAPRPGPSPSAGPGLASLARGGGLLTLGMPVTERRRPHVAQPDGPLAAAVHEGVAVVGVELGRRDHLRELLHVGRLDVHDIWRRRVKEGAAGTGASAGTKHHCLI